MKGQLILLFLLIGTVSVFGQKERKFIRQGNRLYDKAMENSDTTKVDSVNFVKAEVEYRKAYQKNPANFKSSFNIGDALFKQQKMAEAQSQFEEVLAMAKTKEDKAKAFFNYGNSLLGQQKLDESIDAYKNALRNNPKDMEAKYNLEFARKMKQQQQQQQQQNKDQDKNKDQNKDQDKNQDQDKQQQQQKPKISKQNAEQMLEALQNDEKKTQEKMQKMKAEQAKSSRPEQDW